MPRSRLMFVSPWSWIVPLVGAALVFIGILLSTPPGFGAFSSVLFFAPRGPSSDAAAYALGSAASLALVALVMLSIMCGALDLVLRKVFRRPG
jgi:hypothetical protein